MNRFLVLIEHFLELSLTIKLGEDVLIAAGLLCCSERLALPSQDRRMRESGIEWAVLVWAPTKANVGLSSGLDCHCERCLRWPSCSVVDAALAHQLLGFALLDAPDAIDSLGILVVNAKLSGGLLD